MIQTLFAVLVATVAVAAGNPPERRCGWLHNPTPANWWLVDRHGEWLMAAQGGYQAPGMEEMPDMTRAGWVETNGHYGYGCACLRVTSDARTRRITRIHSARSAPLRQCRADRHLPRL